MDNSNDSDSDNSGNILTGSASRVYNNALLNIFDRILERENNYDNTFGGRSNMYPPPFLVNSGNITRRHFPARSPFSNLIIPSFSNNQNMSNLLYTTLNQKNAYKKVLSEKGKKQIKKMKFSCSMKNDKCPILLEKFNEGDEVTVLPCEHVFTTSAIEEWLNDEQAKCPVCRYELDSKEIRDTGIPAVNYRVDESSSDDSLPELEEELPSTSILTATTSTSTSTENNDLSNNSTEEDEQIMSIIENLMRMRMRSRRRQNRNFVFSSFNNNVIDIEQDRAIQEAILASISSNNNDEADDDTDSD